MPANAFVVYSKNKDDLRINDLTNANIRCALVTSSYTPSAGESGHSLWSEVSTNEIGSTGGYAAASLTGSAASITNGWKFSTGNASWTAAGGNIAAFRYAVFYYNGTLWSMTNPLLGYILCDNTPADIPATTAGNTLTITCPAAGWFDLV